MATNSKRKYQILVEVVGSTKVIKREMMSRCSLNEYLAFYLNELDEKDREGSITITRIPIPPSEVENGNAEV
jgi:hypothetical protein